MGYAQIKSKFVRGLVKGAKFGSGKRAYIDDLMDLERCILHGPSGFVDAMAYQDLQDQHPKEWKAIYLELKPKEFRENQEYEKQEKQKQAKENAKQKKQEQEERRKERDEWKKMGGKG